jgi:hypothetical protein
MRRLALAIWMLGLLAPAGANAQVGAPLTHGPDPGAVGAGTRARIAKAVPATWCGTARTTDDASDEVQNGTFKYHAIYMVAADAPNRFDLVASRLQADAFQASALLETSYGRAIRFDMGTNCGPEYLDITVVRMSQTTAQMAAAANTADGTFDAVTGALDAAGFQTIQPSDTYARASGRTRNYLVWLDAPAPSSSCGVAAIYDDPSRAGDNLNNFGGKTAIVFRNGQDGFCSSNAARHEIGHNLGALQPVAPHAFDGAHCDDAYEDTMCYSIAPQVAGGERGQYFDYRNDDYWSLPNQPLPWWTVDESRFLCPAATCNVTAGVDATPGPVPPVLPPVAITPPPPRPSHGRVKMQAKRQPKGYWKLNLRATGQGRGVVVVRCRQRRNGQVRTVFSRSTTLPRTLQRRVRCGASAPRAKLLLDS